MARPPTAHAELLSNHKADGDKCATVAPLSKGPAPSLACKPAQRAQECPHLARCSAEEPTVRKVAAPRFKQRGLSSKFHLDVAVSSVVK